MLLWRLVIVGGLLFIPGASSALPGNCAETNFRGCARAAIAEAPQEKVALKALRSTSQTSIEELPRLENKPEEPEKTKKPGVRLKNEKRAFQVYLVLALFAAGGSSN